MSSCLSLSGVCHAKKVGLSTSAHTLLVFWFHKRVWKCMGHTQTLMLRWSQKVNLFNTVTHFFSSAFKCCCRLVVSAYYAFGCEESLQLFFQVNSRESGHWAEQSFPLEVPARRHVYCAPLFLAYHSSAALCTEAQLHTSSTCGSFLGFSKVKSGLLLYDSWTTSDNLLA